MTMAEQMVRNGDGGLISGQISVMMVSLSS